MTLQALLGLELRQETWSHPSKMKIFISYRRADSKYVVDRIRERLIDAYGEDRIFRDIENIPIGKDFTEVLDAETRECTVMLVIIGQQWLDITDVQGNKRLFLPNDFTRIEVETGLSREEVLVIPVLVMNATMPSAEDLPPSLARLARRNALSVRANPDFDDDMQRLILGINKSLSREDIFPAVAYFEPETILIPQGKFWMGSDAAEGIPAHEMPRHEVFLPAFRIGKFPVTIEQYQEFVSQTKTPVAPQISGLGLSLLDGKANHPISGVTWEEALAFCDWLKAKTGKEYTLPNEAQWEKACRGGEQCTYPWGEEFDSTRCNYGRTSLAAVDAYPAQNQFGCYDMVGNVRQWTCTLWGTKRQSPDPEYCYPWRNNNRNDINANRQIRRVVRGSAMSDGIALYRCSYRAGLIQGDRGLPGARIGFRVAINLSK